MVILLLREQKIQFEENKTTNYLKGIGASLTNDIFFLGVYIGYIYVFAWYFGKQGWFTGYMWILYSTPLVAFLLLYLLRFMPWRKYKKRAVHYYFGLSDNLSYDEWYSKIVKMLSKQEIIEENGYIDILLKLNHQISITKDLTIVNNIDSVKKNHVILVYTVSSYNEDIFENNSLRKRVLVYNKDDGFTYEKRNKEFYGFSILFRNFRFEMFKNKFIGMRKFKKSMIADFFVIWLFQMF